MQFTKLTKVGAVIAVLGVASYLGAQSADKQGNGKQDKKGALQYADSVDPSKVTHPAPSNSGLGEHGRGTNDPIFFAQEMLGRPTDTSVTVNAGSYKPLEIYYEYGTKAGSYAGKTKSITLAANEPENVLIDGLKGDTQYFYRMMYREPGAKDFTPRAEHYFHTARKPGSTYTFTVQFDPHMDERSDDETYKLSLQNMLADKPDFMIDLGDNFFVDKLRPHSKEGVEGRVQLMRSYYDILNHSAALFLAMGNHEGEKGLTAGGGGDAANNQKKGGGDGVNVGILDALARKRYIPNPAPNGFYTGSSKEEAIVGIRQANYAWTWGDATFIVLDPYWNHPVAPEMAGDWNLTLGREQYEWLKTTLETSKAKYKFVFAHNLIGGLDMDGAMRGGIEVVKYLEMGGYNLDGTWGFDKARPGWAKPIHQLLVDNHATIFFHGHDHTYAKQDLDGIVYQEGPQPSAGGTELGNRGKQYNYIHGTVLGGTGYIRVRVSPTEVKADYVETWVPSKQTAERKNAMIADTYTIKAQK
jgi:Calcineurin-like phosphoesterase